MKKTLFLACLLAVFSLKTNAQEAQQYTDPYQLINVVIQKAKENDNQKKEHLRFYKKETVRNLNNLGADGKGKITKDPKPTKHGVGLETDSLKVNVNDLLADRYEFNFAYPPPYHERDDKGRRSYKVNFKPKPNIPNSGNEFIKVANRLSGTLYIDAEHLYVTRVNAEMPSTKAFSTHVLGEIQWVEIEVLQSIRPELKNIVVIDYAKSRVRYKILWVIIPRNYFEQYEYTYSDYTYIP